MAVLEISSEEEEEFIDNYNVSTLKELGKEFLNVSLWYNFELLRL